MTEPPSAFGHARNRVLTYQHRAFQIHVQGHVPDLFVKFCHQATAGRAGIVDYNVQAAVTFDALCGQIPAILFPCNVREHDRGISSPLFDHFHRRLCPLLAQVRHDYACALSCKKNRGGGSDPRG